MNNTRRGWFGGWRGPSKEEQAKEEAARLTREADIRRIYEAGTQKEILCELYSPEEVEKVIAKIEKERELLKLLEEEAAEEAAAQQEEEESEEEEVESEEGAQKHQSSEDAKEKPSEGEGEQTEFSTSHEKSFASISDGDNAVEASQNLSETGESSFVSVAEEEDKDHKADIFKLPPKASKFVLRFGSGDEEDQLQPHVDAVPLDGSQKNESTRNNSTMEASTSNMLDVGLDSVTNLSYDNADDDKDEKNQENTNQLSGIQEDDLLKELMMDDSEVSNDYCGSSLGSDPQAAGSHRDANSGSPEPTGFRDESLREPPITTVETGTGLREQSVVTIGSFNSDDNQLQPYQEEASEHSDKIGREQSHRAANDNNDSSKGKEGDESGAEPDNDSVDSAEEPSSQKDIATASNSVPPVASEVDIGDGSESESEKSAPRKGSEDAMEAEAGEMIEEEIISETGTDVEDAMEQDDEMETTSIVVDEEFVEEPVDEVMQHEAYGNGDHGSDTMEPTEEVDEIFMEDDSIDDSESSDDDLPPPPPPPAAAAESTFVDEIIVSESEVSVNSEDEEVALESDGEVVAEEGTGAEDEYVTEEEVLSESEGSEEYADQVVESWQQMRDEEPEDLQAAVSALIAVVYANEDVDVEKMIRRTPLAELYRYLKQQYWYKIHTDKEEAEEAAKTVIQETTPDFVSVDDMLRGRLQGLIKNAQESSRHLMGDQSSSHRGEEEEDSESNENLGEREKHERGLQSLITNVRMSSRALMEDESRRRSQTNLPVIEQSESKEQEEDEEEEEVLPPEPNHQKEEHEDQQQEEPQHANEEVSIHSGHGSVEDKEEEEEEEEVFPPEPSHQKDEHEDQQQEEPQHADEEVSIHSGHGSVEDEEIVEHEYNVSVHYEQEFSVHSDVVEEEVSVQSEQEVLLDSDNEVEEEEEEEEVVEEHETEEEEIVSQSSESEYAEQIVESWHDVIEDEPDDYEAAVKALLPVIYKNEEVDLGKMLKRMPMRDLYKYLKRQYWYKIHTDQDEAAEAAAEVSDTPSSQVLSVDDMLRGRLQGLIAKQANNAAAEGKKDNGTETTGDLASEFEGLKVTKLNATNGQVTEADETAEGPNAVDC